MADETDGAHNLWGYSPTALLGDLANEVQQLAVEGINDLESLYRPGKDSTLGQSKYDFTSRVFPSDIGADGSYNGHYMVININAQDKSNYSSINGRTIFTRMGDELSKADALRYTIDQSFRGEDGSNAAQGNRLSRPRFTKRIQESIALYMPNSELSFVDAHEFENISMTRLAAQAGGALATAGTTAVGGLLGGVGAGIGIGSGIGSIFDSAGNLIRQGAALTGNPINPKVEVLFANTYQREFAFDFLMTPSDEKEARTIEQIIRTLRFHAAPELRTGGAGFASFFFVPPSEFDITFFYRGVENTHLPRINTCVLNQIDVSYAPSGVFSTFHDGQSVTTRMMLRFRETDVTHKLRVAQGF